MTFATPVAYIAFNRPDHTRQSFARIRAQQPDRLYLIVDGPRPGHPTDAERCNEVRAILEGSVDWPCDVRRNYADENLGVKRRVSSGLDWVFSETERAVIIEDDCVAHPDFFRFCDSLLERYADDPRVAVVTGNNFQRGTRRGDASYYFSKYNHCWGWATWRRAWGLFDGDLSFWDSWKRTEDWRETVPDPVERRYWERIFDRTSRGEIDSWAYPWTASIWYHGGLTATPNVNLVANIGFGKGATHTRGPADPATSKVRSLGELTHPEEVRQDVAADRFTFDHHFGGNVIRTRRRPAGLALRLARRLRRYLSELRNRTRH